jgi:hypothetical protein
MATVNQQPIFSKSGDVSSNSGTSPSANMAFGAILTATGDYTGVSNNHRLAFTADATNGSFVQRLRFKAIGTNIATVARIYLNNGGSQATANNNAFYGEQSLPATTQIATAGTPDIDYPMNFALNPGFTIWVGLGTTVANGWIVTAIAGKY